MSDITKAIINLRPDAKWSVNGNTYAGITWLDTEHTQPTEEEIDAEMARLQAEYDAKAYARSRADEYPAIADQLDMLYWDKINGTTTWQDAITAIKQENPKP